jgi:hypothetical protein
MEKIRIRDGKNSDPGSWMEKIRTRDGKIQIRDPGWTKFGSGIRIRNTAANYSGAVDV